MRFTAETQRSQRREYELLNSPRSLRLCGESCIYDFHRPHLPPSPGARQRAGDYPFAESPAVSARGMGADEVSEADDQDQSSATAHRADHPAGDPNVDRNAD